MMDEETKAFGSIKISVTKLGGKWKNEEAKKDMLGEHKTEYVLVYEMVPGDKTTRHCVFVKGIEVDGVSRRPVAYHCLNSWGEAAENDPEPRIDLNQQGNPLYRVQPTWNPTEVSEENERWRKRRICLSGTLLCLLVIASTVLLNMFLLLPSYEMYETVLINIGIFIGLVLLRNLIDFFYSVQPGKRFIERCCRFLWWPCCCCIFCCCCRPRTS